LANWRTNRLLGIGFCVTNDQGEFIEAKTLCF